MFLKTGLSAILLLAALPAAAQPPAAAPAPQAALTGPQADVQRTAMAFGQCVSGALQNLSASVAPEAGAAGVLSGCAAQRAELARSVDAMIATMPEAQRAQAHAQFETDMGQVQPQIADAIRQHRAAGATPAAPPTPSH
jgi:hypothetical protein